MNLVDIAKLPAAENAAILLHPSDNVAIARVPLEPGRLLRLRREDGDQTGQAQ